MFFVRPLSELRLLSPTIYVTNANMAASVAQFILFLHKEGKCIKRGKNHYKHAAKQTVSAVSDCC